MPKQYARALNHYSSMPWAILKSKLEEIQAFILRKWQSTGDLSDVLAFEDDDVAAQSIEVKARPRANMQGDVMVLNLMGVIAKRMDIFTEISGGSSIERFTSDFRSAVNDPAVKAIVLNIDSPGGSVFGVQELAEEIYVAREKKHIVALANDMAASAAYWIGSAADEFVVTPSGMVGSIGVYTIHEDWSRAYEEAGVTPTIVQAGKYKTEGTYYLPLSEEGKASMQETVDFYYDAFIKAVARGRGVSVATVKKDFGEGRVVTSQQAKAAGMVDRIDTLDGVLGALGINISQAKRPMRAQAGVHYSTLERELELESK